MFIQWNVMLVNELHSNFKSLKIHRFKAATMRCMYVFSSTSRNLASQELIPSLRFSIFTSAWSLFLWCSHHSITFFIVAAFTFRNQITTSCRSFMLSTVSSTAGMVVLCFAIPLRESTGKVSPSQLPSQMITILVMVWSYLTLHVREVKISQIRPESARDRHKLFPNCRKSVINTRKYPLLYATKINFNKLKIISKNPLHCFSPVEREYCTFMVGLFEWSNAKNKRHRGGESCEFNCYSNTITACNWKLRTFICDFGCHAAGYIAERAGFPCFAPVESNGDLRKPSVDIAPMQRHCHFAGPSSSCHARTSFSLFNFF